MDGIGAIQTNNRLDFFADPIRIGSWEIDLVEDRNDLEIVFKGEIHVGQGLGFHALAGIHHQQSPLTGLQRTAHLVGEIDVARGIDQVEDVALAICSGVLHPRRLELDRDAPFPLQLHVVEELLLHVADRDRAGFLQQPVGQGGFPMVDVGNDAEIANPGNGHISHRTDPKEPRQCSQLGRFGLNLD